MKNNPSIQKALGIIRSEAVSSEAIGKLTDTTIAALHEASLFGLMVPSQFGGFEAMASDILDVIEAVTEADSAAGWVLMATSLNTGLAAAFLPERGAEMLFGKKMSVLAGQGAPRGRAIMVEGGYRLSGTWSYGSGILHSQYVYAAARVHDGDRSTEVRYFAIPSEHVKLLGNWDVLGLRATGSVDFSVEDIFVPQDFTNLLEDNPPLRGGPLFNVEAVGLSPLIHGAWAAGMGRRMLDELASLGNPSNGRSNSPIVGGTGESFQEAYGSAEADLRAGRAFLREVYQDIEFCAQQGNPASTRQVSLARLAVNKLTRASVEIGLFAFRSGGGTALRSGVLQRYFRDILAASQHRVVSSHILRDCGAEILGLAENKIWTTSGLVNDPRM